VTVDIRKKAEQWLIDFWSKGDYSLAHELHAADYVRHDSPFPINNPDAYVQFIQIYRSAFPDLTFTLEDMLVEGDRVVLRWRATATHTGELLGIPATGKAVNMRGMDLLHFREGKIIESWGVFDSLDVLRQIGAFPPG
jgi:steroid delta-isomerase-like uncharacterized protein